MLRFELQRRPRGQQTEDNEIDSAVNSTPGRLLFHDLERVAAAPVAYLRIP